MGAWDITWVAASAVCKAHSVTFVLSLWCLPQEMLRGLRFILAILGQLDRQFNEMIKGWRPLDLGLLGDQIGVSHIYVKHVH